MFDWIDEIDVGELIGGAINLGTGIYSQVTGTAQAQAAAEAAAAQAAAAQANLAAQLAAQQGASGPAGLFGLGVTELAIGAAAIVAAVFLFRG